MRHQMDETVDGLVPRVIMVHKSDCARPGFRPWSKAFERLSLGWHPLLPKVKQRWCIDRFRTSEDFGFSNGCKVGDFGRRFAPPLARNHRHGDLSKPTGGVSGRRLKD